MRGPGWPGHAGDCFAPDQDLPIDLQNRMIADLIQAISRDANERSREDGTTVCGMTGIIARIFMMEGSGMRNTRLWIAVGGWLCVGSLALSGTTARQPGLWEITSTTTWQKAPAVPGVEGEKLHGGTRTSQVCLTQEMINDYGALLPQARGQCTIQNKAMTGNRVTGEYVCAGMMEGKGALESTWTDPAHAIGKLHFTGTFAVGGEKQPIEWTTETTSTFKSSSCGMIKPKQLPKR